MPEKHNDDKSIPNKNNANKHRARKRFGQNFLTDQNIIQRIVSTIGSKDRQHLIEIGPGKGALTLPIVKQLKDNHRLTLLELDRDLAEQLEQQFTHDSRTQLISIDALDFDFSSVADTAITANSNLRVFGNLPYNISTPLIFHLLKQHANYKNSNSSNGMFTDMHFMLQKEVVERICAKPGTKTYGRLSITTQYYCAAEHLFNVPPSAFAPQPKVTSAIIRLLPHNETARAHVGTANDEPLFERVVKAAFQQRRKTLRNSLHQYIQAHQLEALGIDPLRRAETLTLQNFINISNSISK